MNAISHRVVAENWRTQTPLGGTVGLSVAMAAYSSDKKSLHTLMSVTT